MKPRTCVTCGLEFFPPTRGNKRVTCSDRCAAEAMHRGSVQSPPSDLPRPRRVVEEYPWMEHANCRGCHPSLFFPDEAEKGGAAEAKKVCMGCVVRLPCLEYGMDENFGVFGGLSVKQRQALRRQRIRTGEVA